MKNPFVPVTPTDEKDMLARIGASSIDEIFHEQIPEEFAFAGKFDIPPALSEMEVQRELPKLAARNATTQSHVSFLGGGIYTHFIPSVVGSLAGRGEFLTSYTPYQPEASQGTLQAFFEYQTLISRLYGMDVSNASLYDGATALGEALFLALGAAGDGGSVIVSGLLHPDSIALATTYLKPYGTNVIVAPHSNGVTDQAALEALLAEHKPAAVVIQTPNYLGNLENGPALVEVIRASGALAIVSADPLSLGLLEAPGAYGADIAVGEGQPIGMRPFFGGETLGIFTCRKDFTRKVPGRLVGITKDKKDRRGYVLTLQTREQHIRRDKATSNICTNHAHNALRATFYLSAMGAEGLRRVASMCVRNTHRLKAAIREAKSDAIAFDVPSFREFVVRVNRPAAEVCDAMLSRGYLAGVPLGRLGSEFERSLLVATTELHTDAELDEFVKELKEYL